MTPTKPTNERIQYVRHKLKTNGVKLKAVFRYDANYWVLRESDPKLRNFKDLEIHFAIIGARQ